MKGERMKRVLVLLAAVVALALPAAATGVNDPIVPGDNCAPANAEAVGHPAFVHNQTPPTAANPPFSLNNPGESTGAQGELHAPEVGCPAPTK
jgi:hypothetical protein